MRKITHLLVICFALIALTANAGSGIFIRGGLNNWGTPADWEFADKGNNVYTLENKVLKGAFKIGAASWDVLNFGGTGAIEVGKPFALTSGGGNINIDGSIECTKITFTKINAGEATLLLEGKQAGGGEITQVYVMGDNNAWNFNDESGKLLPIEGETKIFSGTVTFPAGADLSFWRIYEDLGQVGSWGSPDGADTVESLLSGTLKRGSEGCITTAPGTYVFVFDLNTGMFDLTLFSSVEGIEIENSKITTTAGNISVSGDPASVLVYTTGGALVSSNKTSIDVPTGLYIVVVNNKATKIMVK